MCRVAKAVLVLAVVLLMPAVASAQASLAGVAQDASGAVLPGVTVEASSPVLIEKTRTAVTDRNGRYSIPDLRPGTYTVTFTLTGFNQFKREGVELSGTVTITINAEMRVGGVSETITVSGESPVVDLQNTTRQVSVTQEMVSSVPSSRTPFTMGVLIPGVRRGAFMSQDAGGTLVQTVASLEFNNSRTADQRMMVNGVALSTMIGGGWGGGAVPNATGTSEFAIDVSGVDAQAATGGVRINFIPRDGGNRFSGTVFGSYAAESFASDNYTGSDVQARGLTAPGTIKGNGDFNPGIGGPIKRDKLWFFVSGRYLFAENYIAGLFFNANANKPDQFRYVSTGEQAWNHQDQQIYQGRLTWQATPKNKIGVTYDNESFCNCPAGLQGVGGALTSPEAGNDQRFPLQRFVTVDWNSPLSSRVLLEASAIHRVERWGGMHLQTGDGNNVESVLPGITSVTDNPSLATGGNLTYRSAAQFNNSWNWNIHYRFALSYITGTHQMKVGFNNAYGHHENTTYTDPTTPYSFGFTNGIPSSLTYRIAPYTVKVDVDRDLGLFAQDRWTLGRLTLSGGIRFDQFKNSFPPQSIAPTALAPTLNISYDHIDNLNWKDVTPKLGANYDLFGNGKTSLKVTLNKYLEGLGTTGSLSDPPNPINRLLLNTTRTWTDFNGNFKPDCDLLNYGVNGECQALVNAPLFGSSQATFTTYDPDLMTGWGKRGNNWEFTAGVQHELLPRMSVDFRYGRRWYGNFRAMDDLSVTPADFNRFLINVPTDPRLPNGGGYQMTGFDLTPTAFFTPQQNFVTLASNYGHQSEVFDGVSVGVNARLQNGVLLQAGAGTGRVVLNDCEVIDKLPETLQQLPFPPFTNTRVFVFSARPLERCEQNRGWRPSFQGLVSYTVPKVDVLLSGTFQNLYGNGVDANQNTFSATTTLGRGFSEGPFRVFNIVEAGALNIERLNQIDFRVSKLFRLNRTRTSVNFDFYNLLNSNSVIGENFTYGTAWRTPTTILTPRLFKISAQFDF
jgi:hypothetical protein